MTRSTPVPALCVVFVQAASPGQVLRLLEQMHRANPLPLQWWLTNPEPPHGFRVLVAAGQSDDVSTVAATLSRSLQTAVYALRADADNWEYVCWEAGDETERISGILASRAWWQRLPGVPQPTAPWQTWGQERGLPVARLDNLPPAASVISYRTVSSLDQRSLLVERKSSWYALTLGER